ncbi:hypothetical protein KAU08_13290 [bacterium]|nr:hypothetical protein [bacterium]
MKGLKKLLSSGKVKAEPVSKQEISSRIIKVQNYTEYGCFGLGPDEIRFQAIYDAGRMWCVIVIRTEGFRIQAVPGHHALAIDVMNEILGPVADDVTDDLHGARRLRNNLLYDVELGITDPKEINDLCKSVKELEALVLNWLSEKHPNLLED